jgi:membrane fusion protein, multidrug efflux system
MSRYIQTTLILIAVLVGVSSCKKSEDTNAVPKTLEERRAKVVTLKAKIKELNTEISALEAAIIKEDPTAGVKPKLVTAVELGVEGFKHYIDLQSTIQSDNISYVAPRNGMGGYVKSVYIKEGQAVKKGQLILKLDDQVLRQSIEAIKTQLAFAENVFAKQSALWEQKIGSEMQYLGAKNNVDALKKQIEVQEEQLKTFLVYADQSGTADIVNVRPGELFAGVTMAGPQIQIVNNGQLTVKIDVPENYYTKVKTGTSVLVEVPAIGKSFTTSINLVSNTINPGTRAFKAECNVPAGLGLKPNMVAKAKLLSHASSKAIVVPVNVVQSDEKSKYVFVAVDKNGKKIASRKAVTLGELYEEDIEILSGLGSGDKLIVAGYQNLYEGQVIETK